MADDSQQDAPSQADTGRARRAPPTIDLEATEVTTAPTPEADAASTEPEADKEPKVGSAAEQSSAPEQGEPAASATSNARPISPWVIAPFSGAVAAALVIAVGWMLGWPAVQAPPQISASDVDALSARVTSLEAKVGKPSTDPALAARTDALDKSIASLRGELANLRTQSDKLAAAVNELNSAPRDAAGNVDLSPLDNRIAELERAVRAEGAAIAQQNGKIAESKAADDLPLRRVVAASLLDVAVRHGDPYSSALATAKTLAPNPDELKPLEPFAATGVPNPPMLSRELLALVPKLQPAPQAAAASGAGIIDRLQAGAAKLVKIERTDGSGNDRGAVVARVTAAALRNDFAEARRELNTLSPADRAPAQAWLDKVDARDAALAASRQFADSAMAVLAKSGQ
ncbi:hypothetical protein [Bradyrhizobium sp. ARR65]|uniref:COG4223 family protein n=1 Tax=Bradyrhizobium sp. ARR65 TaxID=1040989 RepID=UPI00046798F5|nr:hypothetical protein [Bradyrhizobium sp. ARR65]